MQNHTFKHTLNQNDLELAKAFRKSFKYDEISDGVSEELINKIKVFSGLDLSKTEDTIKNEASSRILSNFLLNLAINDEYVLNKYYDIYLPFRTVIASYLSSKIIRFVLSLMKTNSKNILYGDHKEKWGGVVGHISTNRKDIALKVINYVTRIRKKYPFISSSYTLNTVGFSLSKRELKNLNDYVGLNDRFKWKKGKRNPKYLYSRKRTVKGHNSFINAYKAEVRINRKKTIKRKYRLEWRDNLS